MIFLPASAALADPPPRAPHDRERAADEKHDAALIHPAGRRTDVLHAVLRTGALHEARPARAA